MPEFQSAFNLYFKDSGTYLGLEEEVDTSGYQAFQASLKQYWAALHKDLPSLTPTLEGLYANTPENMLIYTTLSAKLALLQQGAGDLFHITGSTIIFCPSLFTIIWKRLLEIDSQLSLISSIAIFYLNSL